MAVSIRLHETRHHSPDDREHTSINVLANRFYLCRQTVKGF
ncbi:hypothetical protein [Chitinophaga sp. RAB17]